MFSIHNSFYNTRFVKFVSITLIVIFLNQQTGWAENGAPVWSFGVTPEILPLDSRYCTGIRIWVGGMAGSQTKKTQRRSKRRL